jgi:galacturan 1,4-alpha-galacturonidase
MLTIFIQASIITLIATLAVILGPVTAHSRLRSNTCIIEPSSDGFDDAPAVVKAFKDCGQNGAVVFLNETYHIQSVMNTTGLKNCYVDLKGTLLVFFVDLLLLLG